MNRDRQRYVRALQGQEGLCCAAGCSRPSTDDVTVRIGGEERTVRMCVPHAERYEAVVRV